MQKIRTFLILFTGLIIGQAFVNPICKATGLAELNLDKGEGNNFRQFIICGGRITCDTVLEEQDLLPLMGKSIGTISTSVSTYTVSFKDQPALKRYLNPSLYKIITPIEIKESLFFSNSEELITTLQATLIKEDEQLYKLKDRLEVGGGRCIPVSKYELTTEQKIEGALCLTEKGLIEFLKSKMDDKFQKELSLKFNGMTQKNYSRFQQDNSDGKPSLVKEEKIEFKFN